MLGFGRLFRRRRPLDELDQQRRQQLRSQVAQDRVRTPEHRLVGLAILNRNVAKLWEAEFNPLTARPLPGLALRLVEQPPTPHVYQEGGVMSYPSVPSQEPPDHPPAGAADQRLVAAASPFPGLSAALADELHGTAVGSPTAGDALPAAVLPPLTPEVVLALLTQYPPAVVATQLLHHADQDEQTAAVLVPLFGAGTDDQLVAQLQDLEWLHSWGPVCRWLLTHDAERQALTAALRPGLAPTPPAGELLRSDPTTPATPTPVLPGQHRPITGPFLRQVRQAMGCTQATWALIFGVTSRTIQSWEAERHQMRLRSVQVLQQILTDPEGEPSFRQLGLTLELPDPDSSEPPDPADELASPAPPPPAPAGLGRRLRWLFGRPRADEAPRPPQ